MITNEIWKPVIGFEGLYEVSNLGQVRNCQDKHKKRIMGQFAIHNGRMEVDLIMGSKVCKRKTHLLVARAFLGEPTKNKPLVAHKDNDYSNNHADNLRYVSIKENFYLYWDSPRAEDHWLKHRKPKLC